MRLNLGLVNKMLNLIKSLENEPSTNKKIELLKQFKNKALLKEVLFYAFNPEFNYYIKKLPKMQTGKMNFEKGWEWVKPLLDDLNARLTTGNGAIETTIAVLSQLTPESQELAKRILFRDLRCNVSATITNKVFPKLIPEFKVQLANKYDPKKKYKTQKFATSAKLDGLRCVFKNGKLWTRNGKEIVGFNHIIEELKTLGEFNLVDGELYSHSLDFQTIQGYVLKHKNINEEEKKQIFYNVFAILMEGTTTESMINHMKRLNDFNGKKLKYIKFLEYEVIENNFEKIKELDRKWVSMGYEGLMLRSWDVVYAYKRSDDLLKFKSFFEESLTVVGALEGKGKYQGMLGKFICEGVVEGYNVKTEVGSGFNDEQRKEFWKKKKSLIGKLISVKYQGVTTTDGENSLRFPIFRGFQLDRE